MTFQQIVIVALVTACFTLTANILFHFIKNKFDWSQDSRKFNRDWQLQQLKELYIPLYSIVVQSEYLRRFYNFDATEIKQLPFFEATSQRKKTFFDIKTNRFQTEIEEISNSITQSNKKKLVSLIVDNGIFASQDLLKYAVSYRYVHEYYQDNSIPQDILDKFLDQEVELIYHLVQLIIRETNEKFKACNLPYSEHEIEQSTMLINFSDHIDTDKEQN